MTSVQMRHSPCVDSQRAVTPVRNVTGSPVVQREVICISSQHQTPVTSSMPQRQMTPSGVQQKSGEVTNIGAQSSPASAPKNGSNANSKGFSPFCGRKTKSSPERDVRSKERTVPVVGVTQDSSGSPCSQRASVQNTGLDVDDQGRTVVVPYMEM